jgi:peptidoglycan/xylan/chitin deacetylase (PgdA/CDA1 family)
MNLSQIWSRIEGRYQRTTNQFLFRRPMRMNNTVPYISFTFDDFPQSALHVGGDVLGNAGLRATYYASLGLMGMEAPPGKIFLAEDIKELLARGHELGCHTFSHCHSWKTKPRVFEDSIIQNRLALHELAPGAIFNSFSYPIIVPRPASKRLIGRYFRCARGGGQSFNVGKVDLNYLKAYFLEKSRDYPRFIQEVIDRNNRARGWLIFATHDVSEDPSPFGCTPRFFEEIVKYSVASGARILPVAEALDTIGTDF